MLTLEILIPIVWLTVVAFIVVMCSNAARGDREAATRRNMDGWIETGALDLRGGAREG